MFQRIRDRLECDKLKVQEAIAEGGVQAKCEQFVGDNCTEGWAVVNKEHPSVGVFVSRWERE